jgi:hypothetical protein
MSATTGTISEVIKDNYEPGFKDEVFHNTFFNYFGPFVDSGGDTHKRWVAHTTGNSSVELYAEDQGQPGPGNQAYVNLAQAYLAFRFLTRVTGHAEAALRSQKFGVIEEEQTLGNADLVDLMSTTFMASTYGLEAHIAATGTYGGVARGSTTYIESLVTALSREVQLTDLLDMVEQLSDNDRGARPNMIIGPLNQQTRIYQFAAPGGMNVQPRDGDPAPGFLGTQSIVGMAPLFVPDWTDTVLCFLRREHVAAIEHQGYLVKEMAPSGDSKVFQTSWMGLILHQRPKLAGKLTGCTA